jgi:hypothetical protein
MLDQFPCVARSSFTNCALFPGALDELDEDPEEPDDPELEDPDDPDVEPDPDELDDDPEEDPEDDPEPVEPEDPVVEPEPEVELEPDEDDDPDDPGAELDPDELDVPDDEPEPEDPDEELELDDPDEELEFGLDAETLFPTWPQAASSNTLAVRAAKKIGFDRAVKGRSPVRQFCGQVRELFACPVSVHCECVASRRLLYGGTKLGQPELTCTNRRGYGLSSAHQRTALPRRIEFIPERSISGRDAARMKYA